MRLLIIDDNSDDRHLINRLLPTGSDVREASMLTQAFVELSDASWQPDVILLDLHLPDGSGDQGECWDAVEALAAHAPVIVVSASSLSDDPSLGRKAKEMGAAAFTSKELILFSPENLARQLDWVVSPVTRGLALEVRKPRSHAASPVKYDPNNIQVLIATLFERQESMHQENQSAAIKYQQQLDRIEAQTTKTNGRVGKVEERADRLEQVNTDRASRGSTAAKVVGVGLTIIGFLFGASLKERALIDNAAVRRIADEEITRHKPPAAPTQNPTADP